MSARFKLGFIGAGFIARFQAVALRMVRDAELAGVYALKGAEELCSFARDLGVGDCTVYSSVEELCNRCDAVAVFVPNYVRLDVIGTVVDAVQKGAPLKGIICEKPLGRTVAEAKEIVRQGERAKIPTAYFENQIHMKMVKNALSQLEPVQRAMGPLSLVRSSEEHGGPHEPWFWDPTRQGGGVLSDMACHSIAVNWFALTPSGKPMDYMKPVAVNAETALLKWGQPAYRKQLLDRTGVDYAETPAEDFATGIVTFKNPESGQLVKGQFTNSWMYDKQGLRVFMDGLGPGYAFEINTLRSPLEVFVADAAAEALANAEKALEKATATRGLLAVQPNEADLYGYVDELEDAVTAFQAGRDAKLNWAYGCEVTRLCQAAYMSAEQKKTIDLTDPAVDRALDGYVSLIAQGRGAEILF